MPSQPRDSKKDLKILIFSDGASSGNPGPGGWGSIVVFPDHQVVELGGADPLTTNNRMELMAVIQGLRKTPLDPGTIEVYTDSTYVIRGITQWIWGWKKRGWISAEGKPVANEDLWKTLFELTRSRTIEWKYVRGHSGVPGNERTDQIAVEYSKGRFVHLYEGPISRYSVSIMDIPADTALPEPSTQREAKGKPYSYLSLVGTTAKRHSTWAECEQRVQGQSRAKFKKALNAEDEKKILISWGIPPEKLEK